MKSFDKMLIRLERENYDRINRRLREVRKLREQVEAIGTNYKPGANFGSMVALGWRLG